MEDNVLQGGFGSMIAEQLMDRQASNRLLRIGLPDSFVQHGSIKELKTMLGIDPQSVVNKIINWLKL